MNSGVRNFTVKKYKKINLMFDCYNIMDSMKLGARIMRPCPRTKL
jgi:hypothetical protein